MATTIEHSLRHSDIEGLLIVELKQISDERGTIREFWRRSALEAAGVDVAPFQQINVTESTKGAVRGMHAEQMTKVCSLAAGRAHGAWIDLRRDSATLGTVVRLALTPGVQVIVPAGVANGFQTVSDSSHYVYCFDTEWRPGMQAERLTPIDDERDYGWPITIDPDNPSHISKQDLTGPTWVDWQAMR